MKRFSLSAGLLSPVLALGLWAAIEAQEPFSKLAGEVRVGPVEEKEVLEVPFITWGGDVATFHANGGLTTASGTIFARLGLKLKLVAGDDFVEQVRRYLRGETPFLRGTLRMVGLASGVIGGDPRTRPVVFLQMTWSAGDHLVGREHLKNLNQLKGKKVVLQQGGPHVGMLDDILRTAGLGWMDVSVVWVPDITGEDGPAERFRKDPSIDACCVISPDMVGLTGGLESTGTGAEGTVTGAHVVVSTANMKRSIADVYACRSDYYRAHKEVVEKLAAGYLKACEEVLQLKSEFEKKASAPAYVELLKLTQRIYGPDVIPTWEVDAHGLVSDCRYVGLPGNVAFFTHQGNLDGFQAKQRLALDLAVGQGYAAERRELLGPDLDYGRIAALGGLARQAASPAVQPETVEFDPALELEDKTIYAFDIRFEPNQNQFPPEKYAEHFQRAIEQASLFGNSVIIIRGHSDPSAALRDLVRAGMAKGILKRSGTPPEYRYYFRGQPLDLADTQKIVDLIETGEFDGGQYNPRQIVQAALNLSRTRAEAVKEALIRYAEAKEIQLNANQFQPVGAGIMEPLIAKPRNAGEALQNMRVEFRLINVPAETVDPGDFDF